MNSLNSSDSYNEVVNSICLNIEIINSFFIIVYFNKYSFQVFFYVSKTCKL